MSFSVKPAEVSVRPDYGTIFYMDEKDTTHVMFTAAGFCELGDAVGSSVPGIEFVLWAEAHRL